MKTITFKGEIFIISDKPDEYENVDLHFLLPANSIVSFVYKDERYLFRIKGTFFPGLDIFSVEPGSMFNLVDKCLVSDYSIRNIKANICNYPTEKEVKEYISNSFGI